MKNFQLNEAIQILERTPKVLETLLSGLSDAWIMTNEGEDTWSPFDVIGHLIHGEQTDWIPRTKIILFAAEETFVPFDRFAQEEASKGKSLQQLLEQFTALRTINLAALKSFHLTAEDLQKTGIHPELGEVTLHQLLSCWTAHDLGHIVQISRVMAKRYKADVGVWTEYLKVMQ